MNGIIFDLDGTLWDSTKEVAASWNLALEKETSIEKRVTKEELKAEFGKPLEEILAVLFPDVRGEKEQAELGELLYRYENEWVAKAPCECYEGLEETLRWLSEKTKVFIVSNCQSGYIEAFLENTKLGSLITDYTCPGDTKLHKGKNIRLIMERNHLQEAIYVGDTAGDAKACEEAGIPMIYAAYGFGEVKNPWKQIESLGQLITLLKEERVL